MFIIKDNLWVSVLSTGEENDRSVCVCVADRGREVSVPVAEKSSDQVLGTIEMLAQKSA